MRDLPLGWVTDLAVARLKGAELTEHADHVVVRTPENPGYHWGNYVLVTDPAAVSDAERWLGVFEAAFPDAPHRAVGLAAPPEVAPWTAVGLEVESEDVLATDRLPHLRPPVPTYDVRVLGSAADWAAQAEKDVRENARTDEHDAASHRRFVEARSLARQRIADEGRGAWFGAFTSAGELAADLGIVDCGHGLARYQDVGTDAAHRRRGLAGHLLGVAARWAHERGARRWVIITEADNPAGRVYRSVGFTAVEAGPQNGAQAYRPPVRESGEASSESLDSEAL